MKLTFTHTFLDDYGAFLAQRIADAQTAAQEGAAAFADNLNPEEAVFATAKVNFYTNLRYLLDMVKKDSSTTEEFRRKANEHVVANLYAHLLETDHTSNAPHEDAVRRAEAKVRQVFMRNYLTNLAK